VNKFIIRTTHEELDVFIALFTKLRLLGVAPKAFLKKITIGLNIANTFQWLTIHGHPNTRTGHLHLDLIECIECIQNYIQRLARHIMDFEELEIVINPYMEISGWSFI
jgi:hypothetical protein